MALGYSEQLPDAQIKLMVAAWEPILEHVPTDQLMPSYLKAMGQHEDGPFGAYEIDTGYDAVLEEKKAAYQQKVLDEERRLRRRRNDDIPMPPDIKRMIGLALDRMEANGRRRPDDPPLPPLEFDIPDHVSSEVICNSCHGSGWSRIKRTDPVTGLPGEAVRPCECEEGRQFVRSYQTATEER